MGAHTVVGALPRAGCALRLPEIKGPCLLGLICLRFWATFPQTHVYFPLPTSFS